MAIAPLPTVDELTDPDLPWPRPRPRLMLVQGGAAMSDHPAAGAQGWLSEEPEAFEVDQQEAASSVATLQTGTDVGTRRRRRASARVRRRRAGVAVVAVALVAGLALPASVLGGHSADVAASTLPGAMDGGRGIVYVVRPGDSVRSLARALDPGDPAAAERYLVAEIGSHTVVPGEHLTLP